tara:strand:+ start:4347 stop:5327 length:981 start_codon:yes stop_codon:yes gene_type:complete
MEAQIEKNCKNISKKYYAGLSKKDQLEQCKEIKKSRKSYKKNKYFTRKKRKSYRHKSSSHVIDFKKKYCIELGNLKKIQQITGVPIGASKAVLKRGRGAYLSNGSRPNQTPESWARARLASFILKRGAYIRDKDIWDKYKIDSKIKNGKKCKNTIKNKKGGDYTKRDKMVQLCFNPNKNSFPEHPSINHCFSDSTHQTCCMLGPKAREYADNSGNPIGNISENIKKYYDGEKDLSKENTPWCTCIGSEVCSYYANRFKDGTHIKFINDQNDDSSYYETLQTNKPQCEKKIKTKIGYGDHLTPGIEENSQNTDYDCQEGKDYFVKKV